MEYVKMDYVEVVVTQRRGPTMTSTRNLAAICAIKMEGH
jgi:hypothetical protein